MKVDGQESETGGKCADVDEQKSDMVTCVQHEVVHISAVVGEAFADWETSVLAGQKSDLRGRNVDGGKSVEKRRRLNQSLLCT